ncbi:hypothetical protein FRB96_003747 [Tulasnella sp. 330]|nr:hypothetical protein FRB96_003747 [Tulasnella sp. 330]
MEVVEKAMPIPETMKVRFVFLAEEQEGTEDNDCIMDIDYATRLKNIAFDNASILWVALPGLRRAYISDCSVGERQTVDESLNMLSNSPQLESISLSSISVSDHEGYFLAKCATDRYQRHIHLYRLTTIVFSWVDVALSFALMSSIDAETCAV